ncbi:endonuclease MutS2 [Granulicella sp. S190]|uniref:endonuclease MutS2 n=1 Tax=Granulicella sp. S190 TaxID=1747226 RepID=UPI0020B12B18|nr:Smr/MutS family protein [Granulicella sp. S190]
MNLPSLLPIIPSPLREASSAVLEWPRLRENIAGRTFSPLGRAWVLALEPCADLAWIDQQQQRTAELRAMLSRGGSFEFRGLFDPTALLDKARIDGAALESTEIRDLLVVVERVAAWRNLIDPSPSGTRYDWPSIAALSAPLLDYDLAPLLRLLRGKIEADGSLNDDASPELRRIRRAMERQHRAIEASLRRSLQSLSEGGSTQEDLITIRGDRFVIPVKSEFKRKVPGVIHGSSSSGQTVFVEPLETIEQNNELVRLLEEEQSEIHRILVAMTRALGQNAAAIHLGSCILAEVESHYARARFAETLNCSRPLFTQELSLTAARHPLLELRMRAAAIAEETAPATPIPLTIVLPTDAKQLIISGPNTGGKTVSLKTLGLLSLMAQAGIPVPAEEAKLPLFQNIYADIGDAQSIERNLSSFSSHVINLDRISREAGSDSLVLLDELGSATDPEEGAALAVAIATHFLKLNTWCCITTHLTSLKVYAANHGGVLNAAVGFDQETLTPTYELRLGVPGASAGLNIAARLGLAPDIIAAARAQMTTQTADIGAFLDQLHDQLTAAAIDRETMQQRERELSREKARVEVEGRVEQKARTKELETKLNSLLEDFAYQLRETVKAIDDKTLAQKIARDSDRRMATLRREFSEQFNSAVVAHTSRADKNDPAAQPHIPKGIKVGDLVKLKSLGRQARVDRIIDAKTFEVSMGPMKMRAAIDDIAEVESVKVVTPLEAARKRGGITVATANNDTDYMTSEINVIGRTADEAQTEVERFLDRAFLAGLPRIRIVHGTGMGVLRRTLREYLRSHPHVTTVTEPPQNQGGQGATEVELRQ